jgi:hypothetical protein
MYEHAWTGIIGRLLVAVPEKAGKTGKKPLTILQQAVINVAYA